MPYKGTHLAITALTVALVSFFLYRSTLLPGVDFGDTGSLQTVVGSPLPRARDGYPLYFAIGGAVLWLTGAEPAHALNLTSALEGALACGLLVLVATELAGSIAAGTAAALLFAVSYTFWSQSVIAEVYALHIALVLATLLLLLRWEQRPTLARLAAFFGCYALSFGNHLSMILLFPGLVAFLLLSEPRGWRSLFAPRVVALAVLLAVLGAAQYLWNLRTFWILSDPPDSLWSGLRAFWFDVTKSDWRDTMVLRVPRSLVADRAAMYWFDLRQQFGIAGVALALAGMLGLAASHWRRATLLVLLYAANVAFAFSYNVGDTHVFYLPSHVLVALFIAVGIAAVVRWHARNVAIAAVLVASYAGVRAYRDFPALDRSRDSRPASILTALTKDLDDQRAILLVDLNWQIANGLSYYTKAIRPEVATARMRDVLLYAPALVADNLGAGRRVALTAQARRLLSDQYGPLFAARLDTQPSTLEDVARGVAPGTRYALCILKPTRDFTLDRKDLDAALRALGATASISPDRMDDYVAIAGVAGRAPSLVVQSNRPFDRRVEIDGVPVEIRMDSWLAFDTIRRMGFGHVVAARRHTVIVERGASFVTFDATGAPLRTAYVASLFADQERYVLEP